MSKATLSYRQKVRLGNYLCNHYISVDGFAVQTSTLCITEMLLELNHDIPDGECPFNENHIHHARQELFGKIARDQLNKLTTPELINRLLDLERRIKAIEEGLGLEKPC